MQLLLALYVLLRACLSSDSFHLRFIGVQPPGRRHALQHISSKNMGWLLSHIYCHVVYRLIASEPTHASTVPYL